jgi:hypothetical protein
LTNYCASKLKKATACLELNNTGDLASLAPENNRLSVPQPKICPTGFTIYGADYYPAVRKEDIPILMNADYSYYILDLGNSASADWNEFLRCDRKLIIGSLAPWKIHYYETLLCNYASFLQTSGGFTYLIHTGDPSVLRHFARENHISMERVPFIPNPFQVEKEQFLFLQELLSGKIYHKM